MRPAFVWCMIMVSTVVFSPPLVCSQVENSVSEFSLCVVYDNGAQEFLGDEDYPLQKRLKLGPNEDIAKIFIMESDTGVEEEPLTEEVSHVMVM